MNAENYIVVKKHLTNKMNEQTNTFQIILVDDDQDDRDIFQQALIETGISTTLNSFENCEHALCFLQT